MGQLIISAAGAAIGNTLLPGIGGQLGWAIGSAIGGALFGPKTQKQVQPLTDLRVFGSEYGQPIPYVRGAARVAGQIWWNTDRRPIYTTTTSGGGKGDAPKQEVTTITYEMDLLLGLTSNEIIGISRIWDNGDLIWSSDVGATTSAVVASGEALRWRRLTVHTGADAQLPDPTYEAAEGPDAPAYLGRGTVFIEGLQLGQSGALRNLTFEVVADGSSGSLFREWAYPSGFDDVTIRETATIYNPLRQEVWTVDLRYTPQARIVVFDLATETFTTSISFPDLGGTEWHFSTFFGNGDTGIELRYIPEYGKVLTGMRRSGPSPLITWGWFDAATQAFIVTFTNASPAWAATRGDQYLSAIDPSRNVACFGPGGTSGGDWLDFWTLGSNHCPETLLIQHNTASTGGAKCSFSAYGVVANDGTFWVQTSSLRGFGGQSGLAYFEPPGYQFAIVNYDSDGAQLIDYDKFMAYDTSRNAVYYWSVATGSPLKSYLMKLDCTAKTISRLNATHFETIADIGQGPMYYAADIDKLIIVKNGQNVTFFDPSDGSYTQLALPSGNSLLNYQFAYAPGVIWSAGDVTSQPTPDLNEFRFDALTKTCPTVQSVVEALCTRAGLSAAQVDATALSSITRGVCCLPISQIAATRQALEVLMTNYFFELTVSDKLYFIPRGGSSQATLAYNDLGASTSEEPSEALALREVNEIEIPAQVALTYINLDNDYQQDTQYSDRLISANPSTVNPVQIPLGLTPSEAKQVADVMLMDQSASRATASIAVLGEYVRLEPTDVITVTGADASTFRMRIVQKTDSYPLLEYDLVMDDASVLVSQGITSADYTSSTSVAGAAVTLLRLLDIPILQDSDDNVGFYVAARGSSTPWPGAIVFDSNDNVEYAQQATVAESAVAGVATTRLNNWHGPRVVDEVSRVTVNVSAGTLSSSTRDVVLNSFLVNAMLIGDEIVQFITATLDAPGVYTLSGFLRGGRGTEWAMTSHVLGERVVLLRPAGIRRLQQTTTQLGASRYYKAVTIGRTISTASPNIFINTGVGLLPFAPVDGRIAWDASNNATITWQARTRLSVRTIGTLGINIPPSEFPEAYEVDIMSEASPQTVLRTISVSTPSASYSSADQTADGLTPGNPFTAIVYQISATVGRGYGTEFTG